MTAWSRARSRIRSLRTRAGLRTGLVCRPGMLLGGMLLAALSITAPDALAKKSSKSASSDNTAQPAVSVETQFNQVLDEIGKQRFDVALVKVESLIRARPNFHLAHLVKGDLLLARARPLHNIGDVQNAPPERLADLREEAIVRLRALRERPPVDQLPRYLLQLRSEQKNAIVVDTKRARLYVFAHQDGALRLMSDYYITIGKRGSAKLREGDQKTPIGVYHVTSSLPRQKLTDFYGSGAFPINYPNEWDKRQGRSGHGIWLHGTPSDTYSRPPRASDGCVVLSNADLDQLGKSVQTGLTPVVIAEGIEWIKNDELLRERKQMREVVEQWRADWESRNHERYMQHYSRNFSSGGVNHASWDRQKQQVNSGKEWLKIGISNLSIVRNPGQEEFMVVNFEQDYRSSNLHNQMRKRQYWVRESGRWRIIYEGNG